MRGFRLRAPTMSDPREKGAFQADIPSDAVEEALRSVERAARSAEGGEATPEVVGAPPAADARALAAEAESLRAQLELSTEKGRETLERLKDEHERHLRAAADLENYKKRAQRERDEVQRFGAEKLVKDLIPVLDNLDRALAAARDDDPLAKGVKLVRSGFEQVFGRHGVKPFSALGKPFDPAFHEALLQVPSADAPPGTVVLEHGRGFLMHDRLVRPALVGVSIAPAPPPGPEPEPAPEPAGDAPATGGGAPGNGGDGEAG